MINLKKVLKKLVAITCVLVMMIPFVTPSVNAAKVGDVIGSTQPTDIVATINGYQLESYNVNGYTYICVEDLRYYGFNVIYDHSSRTLSVNRDYALTSIDPQNTSPDFWNIGSSNNSKKILHTDIVTYVNNSYVPSSNINGRTIISFDSLKTFGLVEYNNDTREISLTIEGIEQNPIAYYASILNSNTIYNSDWNILFRAKGDVLMLIGTARNYMNQASINDYINNTFYQDKQDAREILDMLIENGIPVSSVYVEVRNSNGNKITSYQTP